MTVPYNAKPYSNRGYIKDALKEKGVEVDKDDLTKTVNAVRDAMKVVVPGPMNVMSWIEQEVANAIDRGKTELTWVTRQLRARFLCLGTVDHGHTTDQPVDAGHARHGNGFRGVSCQRHRAGAAPS